MITEFITKHVFMSSILLFGIFSVFMQGLMALYLKGYVKASANMKTTRKKDMLHLKNQFETIYEMGYQVRNICAYVDKYLLKLRFMGLSFSAWEKIAFLSAGVVTLIAGGEAFYVYMNNGDSAVFVEIAFTYGIVLACLFVFFHIYGIKSRKKQIQVQLVDYLENYLTNRLIRAKEGVQELKMLDEDFEDVFMEQKKPINVTDADVQEDMELLKNMLKEIENQCNELTEPESQQQIAVSEEEKQQHAGKAEMQIAVSAETQQAAVANDQKQNEPEELEESEIQLLEEFVNSYLA